MACAERLVWAVGCTLLGFLTPASAQQPHIAMVGPRTPTQEQQTFQLPDGFQIQLVASEPAIGKPINLAFDARGRLWVTISNEYPYPVPQGQKGRDRVMILSDFAADGRAQRIETYADGLNIPIGVLPLPSANDAIVYSIPYLWHLRDPDQTGKAAVREQLYGVFGFQDTHGMINGLRLGFDGWIYANHGFANSSKVKAANGATITMQSGNTFRFRRDGRQVEHYTFGQVNPFGIAIDAYGRWYNADCHSKPMTQLLRGAYYSSFGKPHDGLGFGPDMIVHGHQSTALCGLVYYLAEHFPKEYQHSMFLGDVTGNCIHRDRIRFTGSTPNAIKQATFLTSDDPWFRPVDIQLGPDGALYVADFYNRIIGHYEVPLDHPGRDRERGRIWRIVYTGAKGQAATPKMPRADWTAASTEELIQDLSHENLSVRLIATQQLVERGPEVAQAIRKQMVRPIKPVQHAHSIWVLERLGQLTGSELQLALCHSDLLVRTHALRILAERTTLAKTERQLAVQALTDDHALVQQVAAETLGRHPNSEHVRHLLQARLACPKADTHLLHVLRMALRDTLQADPSYLETLNQPGGWMPEERKALTDIVLALAGAESARFVAGQLPHLRVDGGVPLLVRGIQHIGQHGDDKLSQRVLSFLAEPAQSDLALQLESYRAMQRGCQAAGRGLQDAAIQQATALVKTILNGKVDPQRVLALELVRDLRLREVWPKLLSLAKQTKDLNQARLALEGLVAIDAKGSLTVLGGIVRQPDRPVTVREVAARLLGSMNNAKARSALVEALQIAPSQLARHLAVNLAQTRSGGEALLTAVAAGRASPRLLQQRDLQARLRDQKLPDLEKRLAELTKGMPSADAKLLALLQQRRASFQKHEPDLQRGRVVFEQQCMNCHQLHNEGAKVGPQLDGIGSRGLERLLEDILDPNRNVDQALRTTTLALADGRLLSGLLLREEGQLLVLADTQGKEQRVAKADVEQRLRSQRSPMPVNFAEQIPEADFYDLIGYLLTQRIN